ncbi:RICIN domain-containing protein [Thiothrix subterranea]|uniref:RICIN domain-containing protein n=1 Tax=Thiothrix subterranea TaxID=2735563 RepID=UPI00192C0D62|nr:RICIN domain-containing protein [Thiothrix subterranea]QQZ29688.1 RICIN domain-containing protein [Thiothrix subterranea]
MKNTTLALLAISLSATTITTTAYADHPDGLYYIKAQHSGKCVHQHGSTNAEGGNVTQWDCVDQPNVRIEKVTAGGPYFTLRFQHSGKCLTVEGDSDKNGANIIQATCDAGAPRNQTWMEVPGEGKFVKIQSSIGHCLHQHGNTQGNGDNITAWECVDQPNVRFEFVPANPSMTDKSNAPTAPSVPANIDQACNTYTDAAIAQYERKVAFEKGNNGLDCKLGPNARWQSDRNNHYGWCVDQKADTAVLKAEMDARDRELNGCFEKNIK